VELLRVDGPGVRTRRDAGVELEITHTTRYEFSEPVFLDPHLLRFQPRADGGQALLEFELEIDPAPVGQSSQLDAAGNAVTSAWFAGLHDSLAITARSVVAMQRDNPFDYLPDASRMQLPVYYGDEADALRPYLRRAEVPEVGGDEVAVFAARMRAAAGGELLPLLGSLNQTMFGRLALIRREEGDAWSSSQTWREKCGACRDLAWLFVDVCRAAGVAARFVSGYEDSVLGREAYDLHAWAEVYIPGGGWRGYDPARGLAVGQQHVAVAAAATPSGAAPVVGTFRGGSSVSSTIETEVHVDRRQPVTAS
jgi:transglutaminase-like putative cysteine protease